MRELKLLLILLFFSGCVSQVPDQDDPPEKSFLATGFLTEHSSWLCGSDGLMLEHYDCWYHPRLENDICPLVWNNPEERLIGKYVGIQGYWIDDDPEYCPHIAVESIEEIEVRYRCGDANLDWVVDTNDIKFIIRYVFLAGKMPEVLKVADPNCDGCVNVSDAVYLNIFIFNNGFPPCDPNCDGIPNCK